jgi:hypothetical protein
MKPGDRRRGDELRPWSIGTRAIPHVEARGHSWHGSRRSKGRDLERGAAFSRAGIPPHLLERARILWLYDARHRTLWMHG